MPRSGLKFQRFDHAGGLDALNNLVRAAATLFPIAQYEPISLYILYKLIAELNKRATALLL